MKDLQCITSIVKPSETEVSMPGVKVTAKEFADTWKEHLDAATPRIEAGVNRVTVAPGIKAAAAVKKFRLKMLEAIDSGRLETEVAKVPLEDWKAKMISKGVPRIRAGTEAALGEMEEFASVLIPHIEKGQAAIEKLPSLTLSDNIDRMVKFVTHMSTLHFRAK